MPGGDLACEQRAVGMNSNTTAIAETLSSIDLKFDLIRARDGPLPPSDPHYPTRSAQ